MEMHMAAPVNIATYKEIILVMGTAGLIVPALNRIKISPVVGFLLAGVLMGPYGLARFADTIPFIDLITISDSSDFPALSELGILLLMFLIGIELSFNRIKTMRKLIFGFGGTQIIGSLIIITSVAYWLGLSYEAALLIGAAFSLSSTAIVIEELSLRKKLNSPVGRSAFAILLKQDLAVIPFLIFAGLLVPNSQVDIGQELLSALVSSIAAIVFLFLIGHFLSKPLLHGVTTTNHADMFFAAVMVIIIGSGMMAAYFGLSMALGGFAAGLLLAETEYRRLIESLIEPFKGLLLGVFFITVGFEINPSILFEHFPLLMLMLTGIILAKALVIVPMGYYFGHSISKAVQLALLLGPAGEFAFVLLNVASTNNLLDKAQLSLLMTCVALGMVILPVLASLGETLGQRMDKKGKDLDITGGAAAVQDKGAIIIGGGRVGRLVAKILSSHNIQHLLVDANASIVKANRMNGTPIFFGDATNPEFLKKCGLYTARAIIITINDPQSVDTITRLVHRLKPDTALIVRAHDESHAKKLYMLGADIVIPETLEASLQLSEESLHQLGIEASVASETISQQRQQALSLLK
jgi:CPA2 family monovalent cation:H+ antiporter-2